MRVTLGLGVADAHRYARTEAREPIEWKGARRRMNRYLPAPQMATIAEATDATTDGGSS